MLEPPLRKVNATESYSRPPQMMQNVFQVQITNKEGVFERTHTISARDLNSVFHSKHSALILPRENGGKFKTTVSQTPRKLKRHG